MKRIFSLLFAAMLAGQAWAEDFTIGNLKYTVTNETKHYVSVGKAENEPTGALNIPEKVTTPDNSVEYSVTSIDWHAFYDCSGLTSVSIPNSVTSIGISAFYGCRGLTSVTIPNSVTSIDDYAFFGCSGLTSVTIGNSVTSIGGSAFRGCSGLTSVTIPNSVITIGDSAFEGCSSLTAINVESANTKYASENGVLFNKAKTELICYPVGKPETTYTIPNSVTSIDEDAFRGCSGLTVVTIPNSVIIIGRYAFYNCSGLTSITIPNSVTSIGNSAFDGCSGLTSVSIPNSVASIGRSAFEGCSGLTSVTIPNSVKTIGNCAFYGCSGLTSVTIPNSVTSIDEDAFRGCSGLTVVTIPNSVTSIANYTFEDCIGLTSVSIPNSVKSIGKGAFWACSGLISVTIPNSVTGIGDFAFWACSGLTSVTIPNSVTSIGRSAFYNCSGLTSVTIPNSVTNIGENAFGYVKNIVYSGSAEGTPWGALNVNAIPDEDGFIYSDAEKTNLTAYVGDEKEIIIPNSVTSIDECAFWACSGLTSVSIPNSVKTIGDEAFKGCSGLKLVTIPNSVTSIGSLAFNLCKAAIIFCEASEKHKGWNDGWNYDGGKVMWNANVQIGENNDFEFVFNNWSEGNYATLKKYKGNAVSVSIPCAVFTDTAAYLVTYIDKEAFMGCESMKSVKLPDYLKGLGEYAFKNCTALESIVIPDSVSSIGDAAFYSCSSLKSIAFGKSVKTIGMSAFEKTGVEFLPLPNNIEEIDNFAFAKCENLKLVYIPETVTNNEANAFVGCTNATIYCAAASQPETWRETWNANGGTVVWGYSVPADSTLELKFETNPNGTAQITGCGDVTTVDVPVMVMVDSSAYFVTSITGQPFFNCRNLSSINVDSENKIFASADGVLFNKEKTTLLICPPNKNGTYAIPNTVTSIGEGAFIGCKGLQSIEIPNSVTEIGGWAFSGCSGLTSITIPNSVTSIGDAAFRRCLGLTEITIPKSVVNMGSDVFAEHETPITVYCEVSKKPDGWDDNWDSAYGTTPCDVVWADNTPVTETAATAVNIYAHGNTIVVENATDEISVYDAMGRLVGRDAIHRVRAELQVNTAGLYIVKVGNVAKRVMINE